MKLKLLTAISFLCVGTLFSQTKITYETHGLKNIGNYTIQEAVYVSPGNSGENVVWDFSKLKCKKAKHYVITEPENTEKGFEYENANVTVCTDNNTFYFETDIISNKFLGLSTETAVIKYDIPIEKIYYSFEYGNRSETDYKGQGLYYGSVHTEIYGKYTVEADATGILIMPDNVSVPNVIRIKTTDRLTEFACKNTSFINTKYLWYAPDTRYPVFVIKENIRITAEGDSIINRSSFYNESVLSQKIEKTADVIARFSNENKLHSIYPNPFTDYINIKYDLKKSAKVSLEIISISGATISTIVNNGKQKGLQNYKYKPERLAQGTFFVKLTIDDKIFMEKVVKAN